VVTSTRPADAVPPEIAVARPAAAGGAAVGSTITRNAAFTVAGRFYFLVAWAAITPYMLGVLGDDRFAIWALFFALAGYFAAFDLGIAQAFIKYVAQFTAAGDDRSLRGLVTLGTLGYLGLTVPVVVALALWPDPVLDLVRTPAAVRPEARWTLIGMGVVLGLNNLVGLLTATLAGLQRLDVSNRIQLVVTTLQVGGALLVLALGWGLLGLVASFGAGVLAGGVGSWRAVRALAPQIRFDLAAANRRLFGEITRFSAALQIINVGTFFQLQLDKFLLAHFATLAMVTRFELASRVALAAWAMPLLLLPPLVPAVAQLVQLDDRDRVVRLYSRASRYLFAVAVPIAVYTATMAPHLGRAWLGPGYPEVAVLAAGLVGYLLVIALTGVGTAVARGLGEPWLEARYHLLALALHLAGSFALVPRFGLEGALAAILGSGVVATSWFVYRFHRRLGVSNGRWLAEALAKPAAGSALAAGLTVAWTRVWIEAPTGAGASVAALGAGALVFAVVIVTFYRLANVVSADELRSVRRSFGPRSEEAR
jgi:O-antigen/teichoic acid export membrane protein